MLSRSLRLVNLSFWKAMHDNLCIHKTLIRHPVIDSLWNIEFSLLWYIGLYELSTELIRKYDIDKKGHNIKINAQFTLLHYINSRTYLTHFIGMVDNDIKERQVYYTEGNVWFTLFWYIISNVILTLLSLKKHGLHHGLYYLLNKSELWFIVWYPVLTV